MLSSIDKLKAELEERKILLIVLLYQHAIQLIRQFLSGKQEFAVETMLAVCDWTLYGICTAKKVIMDLLDENLETHVTLVRQVTEKLGDQNLQPVLAKMDYLLKSNPPEENEIAIDLFPRRQSCPFCNEKIPVSLQVLRKCEKNHCLGLYNTLSFLHVVRNGCAYVLHFKNWKDFDMQRMQTQGGSKYSSSHMPLVQPLFYASV